MTSPKPKLDVWVREPERQPFDGAAWNRYANFGNGDLIAPQTWRTDSDLLGFEWDPSSPLQTMRVNTQFWNDTDRIAETTDDLDFRMWNARWITGRNFADSASVNMMRLNGSDQIEIGASANQVRVLGPAFFMGNVTLGDNAADLISVLGTPTITPLATFLAGIAISAGGLTFAPLTPGQRIAGDFTNATVLNRTLFQTSTANGITDIGAIPLGTGAGAAYSTYSTANPAASARLVMYASPTNHFLVSDHVGAAYLPLSIMAGGQVGLKILATGHVELGGAASDIKVGSGTGNKIGFFGDSGAVQATGGSMTAAATYTSNEQDMLQILWDMARDYGLLS